MKTYKKLETIDWKKSHTQQQNTKKKQQKNKKNKWKQ